MSRASTPVLWLLVLAAPAAAGETVLLDVDGALAGGEAGSALAGVGDVDGDSVPDLAVGAPRDGTSGVDAGRVIVHSGAGGVVWDWTGAPGSRYGAAVAAAGLVDGDAVPDVIVGAPRDDGAGPDAGRVEVRSGATGAPIHVFEGAPGDRFGGAVAGVGDVDGDGRDDLLVGATGRAILYSGLDGAELWCADGAPGEAFGSAVAGGGDADGDGTPDWLVGAPGVDGDTGRVFVHTGPDGALLRTLDGANAGAEYGAALCFLGDDVAVGAPGDGPAGPDGGGVEVTSGPTGEVLWAIPPTTRFDAFGASLAPAGDYDGDGVPDLVVGAPLGGTLNKGSARVHAGADGALIDLIAIGAPGDRSGAAVAGVGDVDGDGFDDVAVGAEMDDDGATDGGGAVVIAGEARTSNYGPQVAWIARDYTYPSVVGHPDQSFHLILPKGEPPEAGWPVIANLVDSGFVSTDRYLFADEQRAVTDATLFVDVSGLFFDCLEAGIAVASASCTVSAGGATVNQPPEDYNGGQPGGGVLLTPGFSADYADFSRPIPERDAIMFVQYLREHADELGVDPDRVIVEGRSAAGGVLSWVALGPEHAGSLEFSSQGQRRSRPDLAILRNPTISWEIMAPSVIGTHFPDVASAPAYDAPAATLADVPAAIVAQASAVNNDVGATFALNDELPLYLFHDVANDGLDVTPPYTAGTETNNHSALNGFIWEERHPESTFQVVNPGVGTGIEDALVPGGAGASTVAASAFAWLTDALAGLPETCQEDLGFGGPGGVLLRVCGPPLGPGTTNAATFGNGPPGATCYVFLSLATNPSAFKGGTLVTIPVLLSLPLPLDALGRLTLTIPGDVGPGAFTMQGVVVDRSQPKGLAFSNAVRIVIGP